MDWITEKESLIAEINAYIVNISGHDKPNLAEIDALSDVLRCLETANKYEFTAEGYTDWWNELKNRINLQ